MMTLENDLRFKKIIEDILEKENLLCIKPMGSSLLFIDLNKLESYFKAFEE